MLRKILSKLRSFGVFHRSGARKVIISRRSTIYLSTFEGHNRVYGGCSISNSGLGYGTYVADGTKVAYSTIGKYCSIGPGCRIGGLGRHPTSLFTSHPAFYSNNKQAGFSFSEHSLFLEHETATIGNNVWIGANSIVLDGVTLGNNVIVAAGAVVSKDFGDNCIIGGVPARVIRQSEKILDVDWWEYEVEVLEKAVRNSASSDFDEYNHNFRKYFYENESK